VKVLPFTITAPYGQTLKVLDEVQPYFYPHLHRHGEVQITWIKEGEGTLIAGNNIHAFRSGEIYILGANMPHLFKSEPSYFEENSTKQIHATTIFFNTAGNMASLCSLPEMKLINSFLCKVQNGAKIPSKTVEAISNRMNGILHTAGIQQFIELLRLLKEMSSIQNLKPLTVSASPRIINDNESIKVGHIYNYIIQNFNKPLTLDDVAEQAFMCPHAFCRYFKKHSQDTLVGFLNKIRVNEACKMLLNGSFDKVSEIAYSCGFNSITHFNRVFKAVTGLSPLMYIGQYEN